MKQLELSVTISTSIQKVWETLISPSVWWDDVILEPKTGGAFEERWGDSVTRGVIAAFEPPKKLELTWRDEDWPSDTSVRFLLTAHENTTTVELVHAGWDIFSKAEASQLISDHIAGWKSHLQDLKRAAETRRHD